MEDEIKKLREVIDSLRVKASDPIYKEYLHAWLQDPALDNWAVEKLLHLRYAIARLNKECENLDSLGKEDEEAENPDDRSTNDQEPA